MSIEQLYTIYLQHPSIQTDTRKLKAGDIFFALKGDNFNGNLFVKQAIDAGAAFAVTDDASCSIEGKTMFVDDVLTCLQQLARHHREQFNVPVLAITGSNGKTTTKELVHAVLSSAFITSTTEGNLNNHIGVPLTLLKVKAGTEMIIVEMGANHQKEIESYCQYARPTHGLITNCGKAHLEGFGGVEGVRKGKGELYDFLRANNGSAFVNTDYDYLQEMSRGIHEIFTYGTADGAQVQGLVLNSDPFLEARILNDAVLENISTRLVGEYNLPNVLAAVAAGKYFGVADEKIKAAIENYIPSNSRSQLLQKGSNHIILDAYNANPSSMKLAIENFAHLQAENKVLLLGAMAELGEESLAEHQAIVELINQYNWKNVVLVGGDFLNISHPYLSFKNSAEAKEWFRQQQFTHTHLLVKGSRSMQMEKLLDA
ncbi:MAG: UDP-N-acetylmuramoyl-tripeptide--D-alanyl-D-alanine ligase [Chitinophagaceae bacterium]|nr:UDP-N-acetylmuramoyl-tripeptide--D-alanyl-D-alanine ligase [Chitinophagaceae bacterium]